MLFLEPNYLINITLCTYIDQDLTQYIDFTQALVSQSYLYIFQTFISDKQVCRRKNIKGYFHPIFKQPPPILSNFQQFEIWGPFDECLRLYEKHILINARHSSIGWRSFMIFRKSLHFQGVGLLMLDSVYVHKTPDISDQRDCLPQFSI